MAEPALQFWVIAWIVAAALVLARHWRYGTGVGLVLCYILSFAVLHWVAAALYLLPWNRLPGIDLTYEGLKQSTIGMVAFAVGAELAGALSRRRLETVHLGDPVRGVPDRVVNVYLLTGVVLYTVVTPLASTIPTVSALVASGSALSIVALVLKCWNASRLEQPRTLALWLAGASLLPLLTVVTQGFLGFGFVAMLTVFAFVASLNRPRIRHFVAAGLLAYLGLSIYITYMRDRRDIRDVVWTGAALANRVNQITLTIADAEWFDPRLDAHLERIERRLNQNFLIGAAVVYLESGAVQYARGETFVDAVLALVPRAFWRNKTITAGSGQLVTTYTGIHFVDGTSVGIGQVMEFYVNFGTAGVIGGFMLVGFVLVLADRHAFHALSRGAIKPFTMWYLPGLSLLQIGGSLVEVTSTAAAGMVVATVLNQVTKLWLIPEHIPVDDIDTALHETTGDRVVTRPAGGARILATITLESHGGGVTAVSQLLWRALQDRWPSASALLTLQEDAGAPLTWRAKARFSARLASAQALRTCAMGAVRPPRPRAGAGVDSGAAAATVRRVLARRRSLGRALRDRPPHVVRGHAACGQLELHRRARHGHASWYR